MTFSDFYAVEFGLPRWFHLKKLKGSPSNVWIKEDE
jgi:hypothetical protein